MHNYCSTIPKYLFSLIRNTNTNTKIRWGLSAPARSIEPGIKSGEKELGSFFPLNPIHSIQQKLLEDPQECNDSRRETNYYSIPPPIISTKKKKKKRKIWKKVKIWTQRTDIDPL